MEKTVTIKKVIRGIPDDTGEPVPRTTKEVDRAEALRLHREKARLLTDRVIRRYRKRLEPQEAPAKSIPSPNLNDNVID